MIYGNIRGNGSGHPLAMRKTVLRRDERNRKPTDSLVDEAVYKWFVDQRSHGVPISGPILHAKALRVSSLLNQRSTEDTKQFQASGGWLVVCLQEEAWHP